MENEITLEDLKSYAEDSAIKKKISNTSRKK